MGAFFKYTLLCVLLSSLSYSQSKLNIFITPSDTLNNPRRNTVIISEASLGTLTIIGLNELWYNDFERSSFQFSNDNKEWLQMDKIGHVFSSYQMGRFGADLLKWSGVSETNQLIYGATLGFGFLTAVEVLDAYSKAWGFSWGDMLANASGTGLYMGQELLWNEQRIALKYSFRQTSFANLNPETLGDTILEQLIKDYNGQTYWLSFNIHSFFKSSKIPKWLNLAIGYGGEGMLYGLEYNNKQVLATNLRYRQYYLSFDVNLSKIKTNSLCLKTIFNVINMIKIPFPAIEFNKKRPIFHLLYF